MTQLRIIVQRILSAFTIKGVTVEIWRIIAVICFLLFPFVIRKGAIKLLVGLFKKIARKTKTELDDKVIDVIIPPIRLILVTIGLFLALKLFGLQITQYIFLGHILRTLFIFSVFWAVYRCSDIFSGLVERFSRKTDYKLNSLLVPFINKGIKIIVIILAISVIAKEWNYDLGAILAGLGLGGLAFALAAQETLANLFGGLTIMLDKPFSVGDWIQTAEVEGTVEDIGFRSIRVRTFAQAVVSIPNSVIAKEAVTNWSRMGKRRVNYNLGVKYQTTPAQMEEMLSRVRKMLSENPDIHSDSIYVYFDSFGQSGYQLLFQYFTKTTNYQVFLEVKEKVNLDLIHILEELNIEVAYPSTHVYLEGTNVHQERAN